MREGLTKHSSQYEGQFKSSRNRTTERRQTQEEYIHAGEGGVGPNLTEKWEYLFLAHEYFMVLLGVSPHILSKCWNAFVNPEWEAEVRGHSARVSSSQKTSTVPWLLVWPLSLCTVGRGAVPGVTLEAGSEQKWHTQPSWTLLRPYQMKWQGKW